MAIPTIFRCITRRSVLALLATTTGVGLTSESSAQSALPPAPVSGPVPDFNLFDIPLAEGERIISSSTQDGGAVIQYEGGNYRMVDSSSVPTAAGKHAASGHARGGHAQGGHARGGHAHANQRVMPSVADGFPLTGHCASGNCGSGTCGSCNQQGGLLGHGGLHGGYPGPGGGMAIHGRGGTDLGGHPRLGAGGTVCGPTCNPYHYAAVDVLYMTNDNLQNYVGVAPFTVSDYDYEFGIRATLGTVPNCQNGFEATFVGPFRWRSSASAVGPTSPPLTSLLNVDLPLFAGNHLTSFTNSDFQTQRFEAELYSFELNRTLVGWEIIKLLYGVRYIQYDEEFLYAATGSGTTGDGLLRSEVENRMVGGQVGIEMTYPITCRLWSDFRGRAGAFANFAENDFRFANDDQLLVASRDDTTELAGVFELGGGVRYYVTNNFHLRAGAELWYIAGVASAVDQFGSTIRSGTGRSTDADDDVFLYGINAGAEWKF